MYLFFKPRRLSYAEKVAVDQITEDLLHSALYVQAILNIVHQLCWLERKMVNTECVEIIEN